MGPSAFSMIAVSLSLIPSMSTTDVPLMESKPVLRFSTSASSEMLTSCHPMLSASRRETVVLPTPGTPVMRIVFLRFDIACSAPIGFMSE